MSVRPNLAGCAAVLATALALLATACFESDTVDCDGVICPSGFACTADGKWCTDTSCGNGVRDPGEECDDRNLDPDDDCTAECKLPACGDGVVDQQGPVVEECDNGRNTAGGTAARTEREDEEVLKERRRASGGRPRRNDATSRSNRFEAEGALPGGGERAGAAALSGPSAPSG